MKHLVDFVVVDNQEYYISTNNTFDVGLETMVFESKDRKVTSWNEVYFRHYKNENEAIEGHKDISLNLNKYIEEGKEKSWEETTGIDPIDPLHCLNIAKMILDDRLKNER